MILSTNIQRWKWSAKAAFEGFPSWKKLLGKINKWCCSRGVSRPINILHCSLLFAAILSRKKENIFFWFRGKLAVESRWEMIANNIDPLQTNSFGQFNPKLIDNRSILVEDYFSCNAMMEQSSFSRVGIDRNNCICSRLRFPRDRRSCFLCDTSVQWCKIISNCSGCSIRPPWICNGLALVHQLMQIYACWSSLWG